MDPQSQMKMDDWLVVSNIFLSTINIWDIFTIIYGIISWIILPIDELIFFRGVAQPPTR